jgi:hypothetical protein
MATSPIYSWPEPDNTDLVKNGALAIRTLGDAIDTTMGTMVAKTIIDAKGDLIAGSAADTALRLAVGTNGQTLVADSSTATGLKWATPTASSTFATDITANSVTVGKGPGSVAGNTTVGAGAMALCTTGGENTAVGDGALYFNLTGTRNTAVGKASVYQSTGGQNTGLGYEAGFTTTTGTNNTFIGYSAAASSATVSNTVTLGNSSIATLRCQVTSITALSDERDKKNIEPLEVGLDFINELKPVTFDWNMRQPQEPELDSNGQPTLVGKVDIADTGFIAQDIIAAEDAVGLADHLQLSYRDNPEQLEITQGRLIPILVKAIQDLSAKVAALEANA